MNSSERPALHEAPLDDGIVESHDVYVAHCRDRGETKTLPGETSFPGNPGQSGKLLDGTVLVPGSQIPAVGWNEATSCEFDQQAARSELQYGARQPGLSERLLTGSEKNHGHGQGIKDSR